MIPQVDVWSYGRVVYEALLNVRIFGSNQSLRAYLDAWETMVRANANPMSAAHGKSLAKLNLNAGLKGFRLRPRYF